MSSSQNTSREKEENNSPDQASSKHEENVPSSCGEDAQKSISSDDLITSPNTHKNLLKAKSEVDNINESTLNEGCVKNDETLLSNVEESLSGKRDLSIEPNNDDDDLELRYDEDFDDHEIINEDALLEESVEREDDLIQVREVKDKTEIQNQEISPEEEKITRTSELEDISFKNQSDILEGTQKIHSDDNKLYDQGRLLEVEKELDNQIDISLVKEQNLSIDENQKQIETDRDVNAEDEHKEDDTNITDDKNTSTSQDSSFEGIKEHGLNKPDMMLEIPTQEFIEFSDEDDELVATSLKISSGIEEVIDLEENNCIDDNLLNKDEEKIEHAEDKSKISADTDMSVLADPKTNVDASLSLETSEDVNMDVADSSQNDITTNALSYEAEIAADIITKEMNNIDVETFINETEVIHEDIDNPIEEMINSLEDEPVKETTSKLILEETADVIELSDDNIAIELNDSESSSDESIPDQKAKIENLIESAALEEDILNEAEEIDNLILTSKVAKTKLKEDDTKVSDKLNKSSTKPYEKIISGQKTNMNVSEPKHILEIFSQKGKIDAMEIDEMPTNSAGKIVDTIAPVELAKEEDNIQDDSYRSMVSPDDITKAEIKVSEVCISEQDKIIDKNASFQPDSQSKIDSQLPQESLSKLNTADLTLVAHSEIGVKQIFTSEAESQVSKTPELLKFTTESIVLMIDDSISSTSNIETSKVDEHKHETELNSDALKSSPPNFDISIEKSPTSKDKKEPVSNKEESMEVDGKEQSTPVLETEMPEKVEPEVSTANTEPIMSEMIDLQPSTSKTESEISVTDGPQSTTSKVLLQSEMYEPHLSTSKIEPQTSETDAKPFTYKVEPKMLEMIDQQPPTPMCKIEPVTSEKIEAKLDGFASNLESLKSETSEPTSSTSKIKPTMTETANPKLSISITDPITSETVEATPFISRIEPPTAETCEPKPSTSNIVLKISEIVDPKLSISKIDTITSEIIEPTPSSSNIELPTADTCEPTPSTSNIELTISETADPKPTISKIDPIPSERIEPTPSTSKVEPITPETSKAPPSTAYIEPTISETVDPKLSISNIELTTSEPIELQVSSSEPKTSENFEPQSSNSKIEPQTSESIDPQPSTCDTGTLNSKPSSPKNQSTFDSLTQDSSNEVPEMTDSLGLLAESSRVMEDDEEHDDDDDDDDDGEGEDDDDFEPDDESSNQMTAEHSEDSNAHHSESDVPKDAETPTEEQQEFDFKVSESISVKDKEAEKMVCDEAKVEEIPEESEKAVNDEGLDKNKPSNENETEAMDVETVKLSDTSDTEEAENKDKDSVLKSLLLDNKSRKSTDSDYEAWTKSKKLSISKQESVVSYVDLEESSSDEDKSQHSKASTVKAKEPQDMATEDITSDVPPSEPTGVGKETETSGGSPKPALEKDVVKPKEPQVVAKSKSPSKAVISESLPSENKARSPMGLEVFSLDSDEEDSSVKQATDNADKTAVNEKPQVEQPKPRRSVKCINRFCDNTDPAVGYYMADTSTAMYFEADNSKRAYVCEKCADIVDKRNQELIEGMKNFAPLFQLHTARNSEELVEISDSDSDEEPEPSLDQLQLVGKEGAKMLEEQLADMINETWEKFKMDDRLEETKKELQKEMENLQMECREIDAMFNECQAATDRLRNSLYATFEPDIQQLPSIIIFDKPNCSYTCLEPPDERRQNKRSLSPPKDNLETPPAKKPAPAPLLPKVAVETAAQDTAPKVDQEAMSTPVVEKVDDDNMDISVVTLAAEVAPADLPPPGDLSHPPIKLGMTVYAMKNAFGTWLRAKVVEIQPKAHNMAFTMVRVRFEHKVTKNPFKTLPARCLAYFEPSEVRMTIGTRVIALFKDISSRQAFYSGIVAEIPNPVNKYRYLIFFDDGYAQYAPHSQTRLVCEFSSLVWEEVHPYSREFVRSYLLAYPERPMVRLHAGQNLKTEWRGKWWSSRVLSVDSSLVEVQFLRCDRREWIYRGSTRLAPLYLELQAAERHRPRALPRTQPQARVNMPYVEYTRSDEQANKLPTPLQRQQQLQQQNEELRRQRAVAKKSTALPQPPPPQPNSANLDNVTSRVVYYTPKNAVKPHKMTPHTCSPKCKRTDVLALKDLRTYNPLAKPLLSGWERQIVRFKGHKAVMYVAPCGRRLRNMRELHRYLRATDSDMPVDLFDFSPTTHCLAEFVLNKCFVGKKDLSHGKEIVPVPCVNYYDDSLPEFCSYNTERTPTAGVPLNLDPEFLCGCDCEDDCEDKSKCACWQITLEGARTIGYEGDVGYVYRRLPESLPSGIYECNSRCKCKNTCLNRVVQHPLQLKLQVFKTLNRGWGIRALNDVPKGAFLCIYAGNLLTDATANLDGLNEGDEYLAELDYIEVVEQMKEGYEEDIPDKIKAKDKKELAKKAAEEDEDPSSSSSSEEETGSNKNEREDGDFEPGFIGLGVTEFNKRLRRRDSKKEADEAKQQEKEKEKEANADEECITISDDEEVREPSCFTAAAGMGKNQFISKYRSVRTLFGEDEACYIMDAKVQGNIGRYLNHSCTPNVFVQNVFVDTHDPRFPWVAFFALHHIRAGTELTWNYNYDVGSVPGKVLYCFCGAPNCRGRLL